MKKLFLVVLLAALVLTPFMLKAEQEGDYYFANYDIMNLDFLRTRYTEINNGRSIQIEGYFKSFKFLPIFEYKERLKLLGINPLRYNLVQFTLMQKDNFHYSFPVLLIHTDAGELKELDDLIKGERLIIYGRFYKLKNAEYAIDLDVIDRLNADRMFDGVTIKAPTGGHHRKLFLDARVSPTPTPTATVTPTPGLSIWQKTMNFVSPKETPTVTGTITPDVN